MSVALYNKGGLRFWTEDEIETREDAIRTIKRTLSTAMQAQNSAWTFQRVEGPLLTPRNYISSAYDESDIFILKAKLGEDEAALRAETTASSYLYAQYLLNNGAKLPLCVWQVGKSFRQETQDGARASTLRYNEFYQAEFQMIYKSSSLADIRGQAEKAAMDAIMRITHSSDVRMVDSDRLPSYSVLTRDVEVQWKGQWKEMASISTRTDFPAENTLVLEVAIGLDRLIAVEEANRLGA